MNTVRTGEVARTQLDNGLVVLTENIPTSISATLGIWIDVGSKHEAPQDAGISHFVEHMLFKGTPTHSAYDIADVIEGVGGDINGSTDKEQTCYSARVVDRHLDLAIDLVGDMLTNSVFSPDDLPPADALCDGAQTRRNGLGCDSAESGVHLVEDHGGHRIDGREHRLDGQHDARHLASGRDAGEGREGLPWIG